MARPRRAEGPDGRPTRTPIGTRDKLTVPEHLKEPGFKYRIFNDDPDRIQAALDAGYAPVEADAQMGDKDASQASQFGSAVSKPVGGGKRGILMKIREDWYKDDQAAKEARIKENLESIENNQYGQGLDKTNLEMSAKIKTNRVQIQEE